MPTYAYACSACEHAFDVRQSFSDLPLTTCPQCEQETLRKLFSPVGVVFKGSGFYRTDSRAAKSRASGDGDRASGGGDRSSGGGDKASGEGAAGKDAAGPAGTSSTKAATANASSGSGSGTSKSSSGGGGATSAQPAGA